MRGGYHIRISVTKPTSSASTSTSYQPSHLDPPTFVPASVFQPLPAHPPKLTARRYTIHNSRGKSQSIHSSQESFEHRDYRFGPLRVDWVDFDDMDLNGSNRVSHSRDKNHGEKGELVEQLSITHVFPVLSPFCMNYFG